MQRRVAAADNSGMTIVSLSTVLLLAPLEGPGFHFIDVGQGSALLLRGEAGEVALVDSGPSAGAEAVLAALAAHEVREVALWIHSHYDADHIGGFARVAAGLDGIWPSDDDPWIDQLWDRGVAGPVPDTDAVALYFGLADAMGERRSRPEPGAVWEAAGLRIEALDLDPAPADAPENARGLALCVEVGGVRALLPGDLPVARLELAAAACGPVDLLWVSHHGAADAISAAAIELADPRLSAISAGYENGHCHPSALALALLHDRNAWLLAAAGLDPRGPCPALAEALGPGHRLAGADLWVDARLEVWVGAPAIGWVPDGPSS